MIDTMFSPVRTSIWRGVVCRVLDDIDNAAMPS